MHSSVKAALALTLLMASSCSRTPTETTPSCRPINHPDTGKDEDLMTTTIHEATTPELVIAYEQTGPETGHPVVLLHGWP